MNIKALFASKEARRQATMSEMALGNNDMRGSNYYDPKQF